MVIVVGMTLASIVFLFVGWAVTTEMLQQRWWRRKVAEGDVDIIAAMLDESLNSWRRGRAPKDMPANRWAAVQGAEVVAVTPEAGVTLGASIVPEFRTEDGQRVKITSDIEEAEALAARLVDMVMFDVPNLRLDSVRLDIYADLAGSGQQPVLSTTAYRDVADELMWEALTPREILGRFDTVWAEERDGATIPIDLPPIEGEQPRPAEEAAADALNERDRRES